MNGSISAASALANLVANSYDNKISVCNMEGVLPRLVDLARGARDKDSRADDQRDKDTDSNNDAARDQDETPATCAQQQQQHHHHHQKQEQQGQANGCSNQVDATAASHDGSLSNGHQAASTHDRLAAANGQVDQASSHAGDSADPSTPTARPSRKDLRGKGQEAAARAMLNLASNKEAASMLIATPNAVSALCELMLRGSK
jgi:hypothetical protein